MNKKFLYTLSLIITPTFFLSGCLSTETKSYISKFSESTSSLATVMTNEITDITTTQRNTFAVITSDRRISPPPSKSTELPSETIAAYKGVLTDLKNYADGLNIITSNENLEKIDEASKEIYTSLSSIQSELGTLKGQQTEMSAKYPTLGNLKLPNTALLDDSNLKLLATATDAIGRLGYENKRHQYLKVITAKAKTHVSDITKNLKHDFNGCAALDMDTLSETGCGPWIGLYVTALKEEYTIKKDYAHFPNTSFMDALTLNSQAQNAYIKIAGLNKEFENIRNSLDKIEVAHGAIISSVLRDDKVNRIKLASTVKDTYGQVKQTVDFYNSLKKEDKK